MNIYEITVGVAWDKLTILDCEQFEIEASSIDAALNSAPLSSCRKTTQFDGKTYARTVVRVQQVSKAPEVVPDSPKNVTVYYRCGHSERLSPAAIREHKVQHDATYTVNGRLRAESGQYCAECSLRAHRR